MTLKTGITSFPSKNYKTFPHCIAYLDMFMEDAISEVNWLASDLKDKIFTKIFSDNILYAVKIKENEQNNTIDEKHKK